MAKLARIQILTKVERNITEKVIGIDRKNLVEKKENKNGDSHTSADWAPAENDREAFKQESRRLKQDGGIAVILTTIGVTRPERNI